MTRYAVDAERGVLVAVWGTGVGELAAGVGRLPQPLESRSALRLAEALTWLSKALWRCYTHPASAADSLEEDTEGGRRAESRAAFAVVPDAVLTPNLPADGMLLQSYDPVVENAHTVGRALHALGDAELTTAVVGDVRAELEAIEQAECGNLTGRSRQAVLLTRADASPVQVAAADALLAAEPLGCEELFTDVDPTAAAVAAAHWLQAAAVVVGRQTGHDPSGVIIEADDIEALPVATPALVLEALERSTPRDVVLALIREAMEAAEGRVTDIDGLAERIDEARDTAAELAEQARAASGDDGEIRVELESLRVTPLDPMRPARDLLEDLLAGIRGCWLVYQEYVASGEDDAWRGGWDGTGPDGPSADASDAPSGVRIPRPGPPPDAASAAPAAAGEGAHDRARPDAAGASAAPGGAGDDADARRGEAACAAAGEEAAVDDDADFLAEVRAEAARCRGRLA